MSTCYYCGLPPWQHWFDRARGVSCCVPLCYRYGLPPITSYFKRQYIYSHNVKQRLTALANCPNQVRRQRLRQTGAHTHKDVYENFPGLYTLQTELDEVAETLDKERKKLRAWATAKLNTQMLKTAHSLDLQFNGRRVSKLSDIAKSWVENKSEANAKKMYEILFGGFEGHHSKWSSIWEQEYMAENKYEYLKEATKELDDKMGCYQKQITICKIGRVKNINNTFDVKIQMSVPQGYKADKRKGRRKEGDFYLFNSITVSLHTGGSDDCVIHLTNICFHTGRVNKTFKCGCGPIRAVTE